MPCCGASHTCSLTTRLPTSLCHLNSPNAEPSEAGTARGAAPLFDPAQKGVRLGTAANNEIGCKGASASKCPSLPAKSCLIYSRCLPRPCGAGDDTAKIGNNWQPARPAPAQQTQYTRSPKGESSRSSGRLRTGARAARPVPCMPASFWGGTKHGPSDEQRCRSRRARCGGAVTAGRSKWGQRVGRLGNQNSRAHCLSQACAQQNHERSAPGEAARGTQNSAETSAAQTPGGA